MSKRIFKALGATLLLINLAATFLLASNLAIFRSEVYRIAEQPTQPPIRVIVHYTDLDGTERLIETQDNILNIGNEKLNETLKDKFSEHRKSNLECPCHKPEVWIAEYEDRLNVRIIWFETQEIFHIYN